MSRQSTYVIGALLGKKQGGSHLMLAANPTGLRRSERNGPCTAVDFVKGNVKRPASAGRFFVGTVVIGQIHDPRCHGLCGSQN